ncbi:MAG: M48 family peptidase [Aquifex sp.]|nr:MAG: M48 family peptidase [Aquifex sp.]
MEDIRIEKIIRSKRKTIALQVTDNATLIIRAPYDIDEETLLKVMLKHEKWIRKKIEEIKSRDPKVRKKEFVNGEGFLYLGKSYKLKIVDEQDVPLRFDNGFYLLREYLPVARNIFINWYKERAYEKIKERVEFYAQKRGLKYNCINITNAEKRWGSCSDKGNLNFSWRLIMAPLPVIDYVVVHELVHLVEKNHSKEFWNKVKLLMPDYEKYKNWLKKYGYLLTL